MGFGGSGLYGIYKYLYSQGKPTTSTQLREVATQRKDQILMKAVSGVSVEAYGLMLSPYFSGGVNETLPCFLAKNMNERPERTDAITIKLIARFTGECNFSLFYSNLTTPVFEKIAETQTLPPKLMAFEVFLDNRWIVIGVFDADDTCNSAREEATRNGIGTKACGVWQARY